MARFEVRRVEELGQFALLSDGQFMSMKSTETNEIRPLGDDIPFAGSTWRKLDADSHMTCLPWRSQSKVCAVCRLTPAPGRGQESLTVIAAAATNKA
jgi:hypothetical protein